ncbi:heme-binding protein [Nisaea sp.]|uniref:GlcG/HbpS family heme-binding protein n=1 Tax=Nisaea sp. TaxID=2024842 RepID=UPI0032EF162F
MKQTIFACSLLAALLVLAPIQQSNAQNADALVSQESMKPEVALDLAKAALKICQEAGYQVAVAVVDRAGLTQVLLRDRFAGAHTIDTATRKAWTAASFRTSTLDLTALVETEPVMAHLPDITNALVLGGGVPVLAAGNLIGAIGISGAPGADLDDACAQKALETIQEFLDF